MFRWLDPGAFGTLGVGGGFALGAKLVRPESDVWIIYGDGSCGYSIAEIDTFKRGYLRDCNFESHKLFSPIIKIKKSRLPVSGGRVMFLN